MIHCTWPPAAVCPIPSQIGFSANWKMSSWLAAAFSDWLGVIVMFDTSCPSRNNPRLKEYSMLFQNKRNTQEFFFCAMKKILISPFVLEYVTLAINLSLLQHSHLKLDMLDRKEHILWAKNTHIHQSPLDPPDHTTTIWLNPPDRATTISWNERSYWHMYC